MATDAALMATEQEIREFEFRRRRELEAGPTNEEIVTAGLEGRRSSVGQLAQVVGDVADIGIGAVYGIGQTATRLATKYIGGKEHVPSILNYELHSDEAKEIAKALGYPLEKAVEFLGGVTGHEEGVRDTADAVGLVLLGKGGYKGAKTPKAIGAHEHAGAVRVLSDAGVPMTLAQRKKTLPTGLVGALSDAVNVVNESPMHRKQLEVFTAKAMDNAGIPGKRVVPEVMGPHSDALGLKFDEFDATVHTKMDPAFASELQQLAKEAGLAPENVQSFVQRNIDHLHVQAAQNGGVIPGEALHMARTALDKATSDPTVGAFATDLRNIMDGALERQAPPKLAKEIRETRAKWRGMKAIEDSAIGSPEGLVLPDRLWATYSKKRNRPGTIYGKGEGANNVLARAGALVLGEARNAPSSLSAIPASGAGIAAAAGKRPQLATAAAGAITGARFINENQVTARLLGGRGRNKTSRLPTKTEALGAYYSATTPEARKQALEELKSAHTPE